MNHERRAGGQSQDFMYTLYQLSSPAQSLHSLS